MTLAREHGRVLEMAFETFARQWGTQLTARLRVTAQVSLESVEMRSYDEYVRSLPTMTAMVLCSIEPARTTAVVQFPLGMAMTWVEYLLGGQGLATGVPDRELTEIEQSLVRELLQHALDDLRYAFDAVLPLDVRYRSVQYNPQFVQAVNAAAPVIIATFALRVGDREEPATLMFPAELLLAGLRAGESTDNRSSEEITSQLAAADRLRHLVQDVPVEVSVRFAPLPVQPRDVTSLVPGDVLRLNHPTSRPLDVVVGDIVLARAAAGSNGSRLACMVVNAEESTR